MYSILKFFLFKMDPEKAHHFTYSLLNITFKIPFFARIWRKLFVVKNIALERKLFGLTFPNPVGLAAGFDKDGKMYNELADCGFGFIEIGTVTPVGQPGNPKKRLFRLVEDEAIINRMGFNNEGVAAMVERLRKTKPNVIIGGNIGKNKETSNENAVNDYMICFDALHEWVDYFVVNVSSPNTPNLRALQDKEPLKQLLLALQEKNRTKQQQKPILLKIAPDLTNEQLDDIIDLVAETKIDGIVATNTTISREGLKHPITLIDAIGMGGLSGKPVKNRSTEVIRYLAKKSNKSFPIIGVGGIHSEQDALEKFEAGADLIQLYTGFIYEGPGLVKRINKALIKVNLPKK
jgi:dihydroorotate dehydrogenase